MSSGSQEDAALEALLREAEVSEDVDPLGLSSRRGDVVTPLRMHESKLDDFSPYKEILYSPAKVAQFKKSVVDKSLQSLVPSLDKGLSEVAEVVEILTNESRKLLLSFEDGLDKVSVKVDSLADSLGSECDAGNSTLVAPTLWGSVGSIISGLGGKLDASAKMATEAKVDAVQLSLEQQAKVTNLATEDNIKAAKEMFLKIVSPLLKRVKTLENGNPGQTTNGTQQPAPVQGGTT